MGSPLGDSLSASPQAPAEGPSVQPGPLRPVEEELPPPPAEPAEKEASTGGCTGLGGFWGDLMGPAWASRLKPGA